MISSRLSLRRLILGVSTCAVTPCQNGGTCTDNGNVRSCECPTGWSGDSCQISKNSKISRTIYVISKHASLNNAQWDKRLTYSIRDEMIEQHWLLSYKQTWR